MEDKKRNIKKEHYQIRDQLTLVKRRQILESEFLRKVGYVPDFDEPKTFNEKIMWLKLYYQDPLITKCCDKYKVKDYISEKLSDKYIVPTIKKIDDIDSLDLDDLPDSFVIKVNWSSGYNIIVKDKSKVDINEIKRKLFIWTQPWKNCYFQYFNWGYKDIELSIYAEKYIEQFAGQLYDYKLFFVSGKFVYMFTATDRFSSSGVTYTFFDEDLKPMDFTYGGKKNADPIPKVPDKIDEMIKMGEVLSEPFPFVRVDFYVTEDGSIYVGEMTFYSGGGILKFDPIEYDYKLGEKIILPKVRLQDE